MPTLSIDWERSPRIIIVDAPDTEISAQQIVDICRDAEDDVENSSYARLVEASGKEPLGGGTTVGITVEMQNAKIGFADRTTKLETGTVTTPDTDGRTLTDSTALFETNLVEIGDLVVNVTDGSHTTIIEVTSETSVLTTGLSGGTDDQFESADAYEVWEVIPCEITGGNVVAIDSVGAELEPLFPTFGVYAKVSKASTGTLSEQGDIQHASYDGSVHVDVTSIISGSAYPSGNSANPVNNWPDAVVINAREGFDQYSVERSTTLDNAEDYTDASFVGKSIIDTVLTIPASTLLDKAEFFNVSLEGSLGDVTIMQNCFLGETNTLNDVQGVIENCSIGPAKLTLGGTSVDLVRFVDCRGAGSALSPPTINCGGDGPEVDIQGYIGQLNIENKTGNSVFEISINGKLILDETVTGGVFFINGSGTLENNSTVPPENIVNNLIQGIHLSELWKWQGLETDNPMTVTPSSRAVADSSVSAVITGDGTTSSIVTRTNTGISLNLPLSTSLLNIGALTAQPIFTRASTATHINAGLVVTAAIDEPRFEDAGLLIEESRTNLVLRSKEFSNTAGGEGWIHFSCTVTANQTNGPEAALTADQITADSGDTSTSMPKVFPNTGAPPRFTLTSGVTYTASVFAKAGTHDKIQLTFFTSTHPATTYANFDLTNGVLGTVGATCTATIDLVGNGWYRCTMTSEATATQSAGGVLYGLVETLAADRNVGFSSAAGTEDVYLWGAQVEAGEFATSYIETTTAQVTRSADFFSYDTDNFVEDFTGGVYAEITPLFGSTISNNAVVVNCTNALVGPMYILDDTTQKVVVGDGTNTNSVDPTFVGGTTFKCATRWSDQTGEIQSIASGVATAAGSYDGAFARTAGTLYIGSDSTGNHLNGNIKGVKVYVVDPTELQLVIDTT